MAQINFFSPTHAILAKEIKYDAKNKLSIVDYGCGEGELLQYLNPSMITEYQGFEVNAPCIPIAQEKWKAKKKFEFHFINRKKLPSIGQKNAVDAVFLVGVVQYLPKEDLQHILKEAKKVLKPGGKLLISCTTDHLVYKWFNIYKFFLPIHTVNRKKLLKQIEEFGLQIEKAKERGIFFAPFFSNILIFFFDAFDKVIFRKKGELGPVGRKVRALYSPIVKAEFDLGIDYGYTLFIVATK